MNISRHNFHSVFLGGDLVILLITFFIGFSFFGEKNYKDLDQPNLWMLFAIFTILWLFIGYFKNLYSVTQKKPFSSRIINYIKAYLILIGFVIIYYLIFPFPEPIRNFVIIFLAGFPFLGITFTYLLLNITSIQSNNTLNFKYTLVAGVGDLAKNVEDILNNQLKYDQKIRGFIKCKNEKCLVGPEKVVGDLKSLSKYLADNPVDEILIALPVKYSKKIKKIVLAADYHGVRVKYIPDYIGLFGNTYKTLRYGKIDAVNIRQFPLDEKYAFLLKNYFDKIFSFVALISLFPLLLFLAFLIKLESPGSVFYCPIRIGKSGKPFKLYKFRSMINNDDPNGGLLSTQIDDSRITKVGKILRKYSLDELPQFLNVLLGDMSVVGPRPHRRKLNMKFQETEDKYMIRHYFKPGITGWAQINGWRGPTDTKEQKTQRTKHDLWYYENWSFALDIKIIFLTIFGQKTRKNAF
jgi:putative colanic acid biosynthesis UDP-glucose lipid carrier transferase